MTRIPRRWHALIALAAIIAAFAWTGPAWGFGGWCKPKEPVLPMPNLDDIPPILIIPDLNELDPGIVYAYGELDAPVPPLADSLAAAPEPATVLMGAIGAGLVLARSWRRRSGSDSV